jgi:hypothetical protein
MPIYLLLSRKIKFFYFIQILCRIELLLGNDCETNNGTTAAKQQPACQLTDWKAMFSAGSAPMTAHGTMDTIRSGVFYAICAEG